MIYVIGNSHASIFSGQEPIIPFYNEGKDYPKLIDDIIPLRFSITLAYNLWDKDIDAIMDYLIHSNIDNRTDKILLCYGEVDCRWHLPNQAHITNTLIDNKIIECVDRYFKVFDYIKKNNFDVIAWEVHPSCLEGHNTQADKPIFGDCLYRNYISRKFNMYLSNICHLNNIPIIGIFNDMIKEDGLTDISYMMDYCHLGMKAVPLIERELKKIL